MVATKPPYFPISRRVTGDIARLAPKVPKFRIAPVRRSEGDLAGVRILGAECLAPDSQLI